MMFYIALFGALINCFLFHITGEKGNLFLGFLCALGAALNHLTTPEKDQEE